jgi:hypothetical protein
MQSETLAAFSKEELIELVQIYCKSIMVMDGCWFQSIEHKRGMDEAIFHDIEAWKGYVVSEARRIKAFLKLSDQPGLEGLEKALLLHFPSVVADVETTLSGTTLTYRIPNCNVQVARKRKNMELHPCKPVGEVEYSIFAKAIDPRVTCECLSCYPEITDETCSCAWRFTLEE